MFGTSFEIFNYRHSQNLISVRIYQTLIGKQEKYSRIWLGILHNVYINRQNQLSVC